jgi:hypothetical protein
LSALPLYTTVGNEDTIVRALREARRTLELLALVPDLIPEDEHITRVALLDTAEIIRHGELAAREVMAVPVSREPRRPW